MTIDPPARPQLFDWVSDVRGDVVTVTFRGELDIVAARDCTEDVRRAMWNGASEIVVDLSGLAFMDSTGLRMFVDLKQLADRSKKRFLIAGASDAVLRIFDVMGLVHWFEYADGYAPQTVACPQCGGDTVFADRRCPRCGAA